MRYFSRCSLCGGLAPLDEDFCSHPCEEEHGVRSLPQVERGEDRPFIDLRELTPLFWFLFWFGLIVLAGSLQ